MKWWKPTTLTDELEMGKIKGNSCVVAGGVCNKVEKSEKILEG
jgi:hypothetical protein